MSPTPAAIVVDSSAITAMLLGEPEADRIREILVSTPEAAISSFSLFETSVVAAVRKGPQGMLVVDALLSHLALDVVPLDTLQVELARDGWLRFGKGRHPASLNLGDCVSYALARHLGRPLLFKGNDFGQTDLPLVAL